MRPTRLPPRAARAVRFKIDDKDPSDQYALLYADPVVNTINRLTLPRYGLGNYIDERPHDPPSAKDSAIIADLSRAGHRLKGFCRTNLFKRLESSGTAFLLSVERHILRNCVYLHALEEGEPVPIGTQDAGLLDSRFTDEDNVLFDEDNPSGVDADGDNLDGSIEELRRRAAEVYAVYRDRMKRRFRWLGADCFKPELADDLNADVESLLSVLHRCGSWNADGDRKLDELVALIRRRHPGEKILLFSQFADSVDYLLAELQKRSGVRVAAATGDSENPTRLAWRFSPVSNKKREKIPPSDELDVLLATDILSEGQNLQDCSVVVNYDLPWAIIRLIQRAGRVDRIGQKAETIQCYTFLPAEGVERIIRLRARLRQRLQENAEVVGTDEAFFDDDQNDQAVRDLFTENAGILDGEADTEVDLGSFAYQIWKKAIDRDASLEKTIRDLPDVIYSTKSHVPEEGRPEGVLAYVKTADGHDALAWLDQNKTPITESQFAILQAAACEPDEPSLPRRDSHHAIVQRAVELIAEEEKTVGGQLGGTRGARFRVYERLKRFADDVKDTLFNTPELRRAVEEIYNYPLREVAKDTLNRQLRSGIGDAELAQLVMELRQESKLCIIHDEDHEREQPRIICSLGLSAVREAQT